MASLDTIVTNPNRAPDWIDYETPYYEYLAEHHPNRLPKSLRNSTFLERHTAGRQKTDRKCSNSGLASKLRKLDGMKDVLVGNTNMIRFDRGNFMSASTGKSKEYRQLRAEVESMQGIKRAKPGPKTGGSVSTGESRQRVVSNAMQQAANRIKLLTDRAIADDSFLRFQTITWSPEVPLQDRIDIVNRLQFMLRRYTDEYVFVWGIGEKPLGDTDFPIRKHRLHLHLHIFTILKSYRPVGRIVEQIMTQDSKYKNYEYSLNNQRLTRAQLEAKTYHMAVYGSKNLASFKPTNLENLVDLGIYSDGAMEELQEVRTDFRLYMCGTATNRELRERSTNEEIPIVRNGQDACNQVLLHFSKSRDVPIEQMDVGISDDGSKFWANHDPSTIKAYHRTLNSRYVEGNALPIAFYRAWTLFQEADYQPEEDFFIFLAKNPLAEQELEKRRVARHRTPDFTNDLSAEE